MNSTWNNNISLLKKRFPQLALILKSEIERFNSFAGTEQQAVLHPFWNISNSKSGELTASENNLKLHSAYSPQKEAQSIINSKKETLRNAKSVVFMAFGLGYSVLECIKDFPLLPVLIIEPEPKRFFAAMLYLDWQDFFQKQNITLAVGCTPDQVINLISINGFEKSVFISVAAQKKHAEEYFSVLQTLIDRNISKEKINQATLKKFGKLWKNNIEKNYDFVKKLDGVEIYKEGAKDIPFFLIAAGPSLQGALKFLSEIKKRGIVVCVDTALKACLQAKIEPDFVLLTVPQYWAYRHIANLKSPSSVLITEVAVYPSVFRWPCRKIVACKSQVRIQDYSKYCMPEKGDLGSGGSVASSAWNFCVFCGAKQIFTLGLDFSFPRKQTHISGSSFEQAVHSSSTKIKPAETASMPLLFSGNVSLEKNYFGKPVLSDQKMKMFAWWFESRIQQVPDVKTFSLFGEGLFIPGIKPCNLNEILSLPEIESLKKDFFKKSEKKQDRN